MLSQKNSNVNIFIVCLVLVITTSAGNFKVSEAAAEQYRPTPLHKCPVTNTEINQAKGTISKQLTPILDSINTPASPQPETTATTVTTPTTPPTTHTPTPEPPEEEIGEYFCNGTPGWWRVVLVDMTNHGHNCPSGLNTILSPRRTCGRSFSDRFQCSSTRFVNPVQNGRPYSQVCGRIDGYQIGSTSAFWGYHIKQQSIDGYYVDGISLTHGPPGRRQHIWTFAAGLIEVESSDQGFQLAKCPCDTTGENIVATSPPFVGNNYFCETAIHEDFRGEFQGRFFGDDPLWDGLDCRSSSCCHLNNPPWFTKTLPRATTDSIELRLCMTGFSNEDDVGLELIELYVK